MSIARECCLLTVTLVIPTTVEFSQWMGVGGWGWPIYSRARQIDLPFLMFKNKLPGYASTAEDATCFIMFASVWTDPLKNIG